MFWFRKKRKIPIIILTLTFLILVSCKLPITINSQNSAQSDQLGETITAMYETSSALQSNLDGLTQSPTNQATTPTAQDLATVEVTTPTAQIIHSLMPGEPAGNHESGMTDSDSSTSALEKRASAGENFSSNLFERPFNPNTMDVYYPELDVIQAWLNHNDTWLFVMIKLHGVDSEGKASGSYGAEFDLNVDGRGEFLVFASQPSSEWSVDGVQVWQDTDQDVGHNFPVNSDPPQGGNGYDKMLFNSGQGSDPDMAWARIDPGNPQIVQIALKYSVLNNDGYYMWGAWAQDEFHPEWFDYDDHFTLTEAGSASTSQSGYYPIKALAKVDNTCRWSVGFEPTGGEPGICYVAPTPTPPPTAVPVVPGTITGVVYYDFNANKIREAGEFGLPGAKIKLTKGSCSSGGSSLGSGITNASGAVVFSDVIPGKYCLTVTSAPPGGYKAVDGTGPITITLPDAGSITGYLPYTIYIY